jgi:FtsH-binding integral membrane protein
MVAFAVVFWMVVQSSIAAAFIGASLAWLMVSVTAWYLQRQMRSARKARVSEKRSGSAISRSR